MLTEHDWHAALAGVSGELRTKSQVFDPPVDALCIARAAGLTITLDRTQAGRGRLKRIDGRPAMFLRPEPRPERLQWTAAHELGELHAAMICHSVGVRGDELSPAQREQLANRFATELLLPLDWFRRECETVEYDLPALKARFSTASHELLAWRMLDLADPGIVTIYDQGLLTRRRGNTPCRTLSVLPCERDCWKYLRNVRQPRIVRAGPFTVRGWCIDSPGWEREILYARIDGEVEVE